LQNFLLLFRLGDFNRDPFRLGQFRLSKIHDLQNNRSGAGGNGLAQVTINSTLINFKTYFSSRKIFI
jgi:hypothetical protein